MESGRIGFGVFHCRLRITDPGSCLPISAFRIQQGFPMNPFIAPFLHPGLGKIHIPPFNLDDLAKSYQMDGKAKSSTCKARKS